MAKGVELSIVILYFLLCIGIGVWSRRLVANRAEEYWAAGRSIGTFLNSWAILAALTSGGSTLAAPGTAYKLGVPYGSSLVAGAICGFSLASVLVARYLRNAEVYTVPEFLGKRYNDNKTIGILVPIIVLLTNGMYMVAQLKATGLVISWLTGLPYVYGLVIGTVTFILYVSIGGMWAVTYTDVIQGMLLTFVTIALTVTAVARFGLGNMATHVVTDAPQLGSIAAALPYSSYVGGFISWALAVCVLPHLMMRVFTARNVRSARLSLNYGMLIYAFVMASAVLLAMACSFLPSDVLRRVPADQYLLNLGDMLFGPIMKGVLVAGVAAAVMSTASGLLLACSAAFTNDLYKQYIRPNTSEREVVRVALVTTWVVGVATLILSIKPPPFLVVLYTAAVAFLVSSLFAPLILGIWWRRMNTAGAIAGLIVGAVTFSICFFGLDMPASTEILVALPLSLVAAVVASLCTKPPAPEEISFLRKIHEAGLGG